mmetsp:Transcript_73062/g.128732  ORF Transcript_73062/g.128732 Transcript_73062/m.128732 type:complete len:103 (-) Transcript_73062:148-456(-)
MCTTLPMHCVVQRSPWCPAPVRSSVPLAIFCLSKLSQGQIFPRLYLLSQVFLLYDHSKGAAARMNPCEEFKMFDTYIVNLRSIHHCHSSPPPGGQENGGTWH